MVINTQYIGPMIYEFIIGIIALIVILKIAQKYREKRNNVTLFMFLFSFILNLAVFVAAVSRVLRVTNLWEINPVTGTYLELLAVTVSLIAIANIFLLAFTLEVFYNGMDQRKNKLYVLGYSVIVAIFVIFSILTGIETVDLTLPIWAFLVIISAVVYIFMIISAWKVARKIEPGLQKRSTQIIALSPLSFLTVFIFFMLDIIEGGNFTIFYYIGWVFALVSIFTLYIGVVRPGWFINMVKPVKL